MMNQLNLDMQPTLVCDRRLSALGPRVGCLAAEDVALLTEGQPVMAR